MTHIRTLDSYSEGRWLKAARSRDLLSAIDGSLVATMPEAADAAAMLNHARTVGGPALRAMTFQERGQKLRAIAEVLAANKEALYALSAHTGATRSDSAFDIEGGIGTFFAYSSLARKLPDAHFLPDGERLAISKGDFSGQHLLAPMHGVAVHINAYNFPVWGLLEKLAPTLLAGMPALIKPATVGAYLAEAAFRIIVESGILPPGSVQLLLGEPGELFDHLGGQDSVAFTGSAATAGRLKAHPALIRNTVRFTAEQDSLNAAILGLDATIDAPEFDLFVREVVREITQKAGQKCTAIRRILVPRSLTAAAGDAIVKRLEAMTIGDPRDERTRLGALAGTAQRDDVVANLAALRGDAELLCGGVIPDLGPELAGGAFFEATLLRCDRPFAAPAVHAIEAFGPVATLMPYDDSDEAIAIANAGAGSLALSIFSHDRVATARMVTGVSTFHGRIMLIDRDNAAAGTGHGAALPQLQHGGPGRAGGGAELGGTIGMLPYLQRTAVQASAEMLSALETL